MRKENQQDRVLIEFANTLTNQLGGQAIARAAETLPPELRETAFAFAATWCSPTASSAAPKNGSWRAWCRN